MNIYCVIFMCTFGSNSTDTEKPLPPLIQGSSGNHLARTPGIGRATTHADVASMILPERGEPVPHMGDIVMELPKINQDRVASSAKNTVTPSKKDSPGAASPTLSEILLPPSAHSRNRFNSK